MQGRTPGTVMRGSREVTVNEDFTTLNCAISCLLKNYTDNGGKLKDLPFFIRDLDVYISAEESLKKETKTRKRKATKGE